MNFCRDAACCVSGFGKKSRREPRLYVTCHSERSEESVFARESSHAFAYFHETYTAW